MLRSILEIMYFGSGVVIAVAAVLALRQLRIAEKALVATKEQMAIAAASLEQARVDLQTKARREAVTLAAQLCAKYAEVHVGRLDEQTKKAGAAGVVFSVWDLRDNAFLKDSVVDTIRANQWIAKVLASEDAYNPVVDIANELEAFAIYFTRGAADEATAFTPIGALFCSTVAEVAPFIVHAREASSPPLQGGRYENVVELYAVWQGRLRQNDLRASVVRIQKQLTAIDPRVITPIGVEKGA